MEAYQLSELGDKEKIFQLELALSELLKELSYYRNGVDISQLLEIIREKDGEIDYLKDLLTKLEGKNVSLLQTKVTLLSKQESLFADIERLQHEKAVLMSRNIELEDLLQCKEKEILDLLDRINELDNKIKELEEFIRLLENNIRVLNRNMTELQNRYYALLTEKNELQKAYELEKDRLTKQISEQSIQIEELTSENNEIKIQLEEERDKNIKLLDELAIVQNDLLTTQQTLAHKSKEAEEYKRIIQSLQEEINKLKHKHREQINLYIAENNDYKDQLDQERENNNDLTNTINSLRSEIEATENKLRDKSTELDEYKDQLKQEREKVAYLSKELGRKEQDILTLEDALSSKSNEMEDYKTSYESLQVYNDSLRMTLMSYQKTTSIKSTQTVNNDSTDASTNTETNQMSIEEALLRISELEDQLKLQSKKLIRAFSPKRQPIKRRPKSSPISVTRASFEIDEPIEDDSINDYISTILDEVIDQSSHEILKSVEPVEVLEEPLQISIDAIIEELVQSIEVVVVEESILESVDALDEPSEIIEESLLDSVEVVIEELIISLGQSLAQESVAEIIREPVESIDDPVEMQEEIQIFECIEAVIEELIVAIEHKASEEYIAVFIDPIETIEEPEPVVQDESIVLECIEAVIEELVVSIEHPLVHESVAEIRDSIEHIDEPVEILEENVLESIEAVIEELILSVEHQHLIESEEDVYDDSEPDISFDQQYSEPEHYEEVQIITHSSDSEGNEPDISFENQYHISSEDDKDLKNQQSEEVEQSVAVIEESMAVLERLRTVVEPTKTDKGKESIQSFYQKLREKDSEKKKIRELARSPSPRARLTPTESASSIGSLARTVSTSSSGSSTESNLRGSSRRASRVRASSITSSGSNGRKRTPLKDRPLSRSRYPSPIHVLATPYPEGPLWAPLPGTRTDHEEREKRLKKRFSSPAPS